MPVLGERPPLTVYSTGTWDRTRVSYMGNGDYEQIHPCQDSKAMGLQIIISFCLAGFSIVNAMVSVIKKSNESLNFLPSIEATRWSDRQTTKWWQTRGRGRTEGGWWTGDGTGVTERMRLRTGREVHEAMRKSSHQHTSPVEEKRSQEQARAHAAHDLSRSGQNFVFLIKRKTFQKWIYLCL